MAVNNPIVLGFDPGRINFAFGIYGEYGIGDHGDLEGIEEVVLLPYFRARLRRKLKRYLPDAVFIERYHMRPNSAGAIINMEVVNLMIGIVYEQCFRLHIPCYLITASMHKTWAHKNLNVPKKIIRQKKKEKEVFDLTLCPDYLGLPTEHEVDATNLARYGYEKLTFNKQEI